MSRSMFVMRLPKRSTATTTPSSESFAAVARRYPPSSMADGLPRSCGWQRPAASSAAMGANMSRPWNVALTTSMPNLSRPSKLNARTDCTAAPAASGASSPLSGANSKYPWTSAIRMARSVPAPRSTTARCTVPVGKYCHARASQNPASSGSKAGDSCARSMTFTAGARVWITPFMTPTNGSRRPKSVVRVMTPLGRNAATENSAESKLRDHVRIPPRCQSHDGRSTPRDTHHRQRLLPAERCRGAGLPDGLDAPVRHRVRDFRTRRGNGARGLHGRPRRWRLALRTLVAAHPAARPELCAARTRHRRERAFRGPRLAARRGFRAAVALRRPGGSPVERSRRDHGVLSTQRLCRARHSNHIHGRHAPHAGAIRRCRGIADRAPHRPPLYREYRGCRGRRVAHRVRAAATVRTRGLDLGGRGHQRRG